jgi:hypothetical protein
VRFARACPSRPTNPRAYPDPCCPPRSANRRPDLPHEPCSAARKPPLPPPELATHGTARATCARQLPSGAVRAHPRARQLAPTSCKPQQGSSPFLSIAVAVLIHCRRGNRPPRAINRTPRPQRISMVLLDTVASRS